jgi:flagellar biosynthesis protein FlhB
MSDDESGVEKEHDPTERRLEEARNRGDIAKSMDLNTAAAFGGLLVAAMAAGGDSLTRIGTLSMTLLSRADELAPLFLSGDGGPMGGIMGQIVLAALPWFALPALAVMMSLIAQNSIVFTGENLQLKLSRISPISTAKQKFGPEGLFEFAKSAAKMTIVGVILGMFLANNLTDILGSMALSPGMATVVLLRLVVQFLLVVLIVAFVIGIMDFLWQKYRLIERNKMSRQDIIDEMKQSEGDPFVKQQRRQRGYDIAMNQMLADVASADVVIVNPTHYAVALRWRRGDQGAPVCVAKGVDEIAARIRAVAAEAGVPLHRDPPTARAVHASVEIGQEIHAEHYRAVAAAIRFAERLRAKARAQRPI